MAIDISKLGKIECSAEVETTIGKLSLFFLSLKHSYILSTALRHMDDERKPLQCIKILITLVCYPKDSLKNGKYKPEERVLNLEDVDKLSEEEIKNLAEIYIENNSSLYKDKISWIELNDEGKEIHYSKYEGIKYPKEEKESSIDYLYKLLKLEDERQREQMNSMFNLIPKLSSFSPNLQTAVVSNLVAGSAITEAMKTNKFFESNLKAAANSHRKLNDNVMQVQDRVAKAKREPFDKLGAKLDTLIQFTSTSTENLVQGNSRQAQMGAEIKSVGDETNELQKKLLQETIEGGNRSDTKTNVVILLTIIGIVTTLFISFYSENTELKNTQIDDSVTSENTKRDIETLKEANSSYQQEVKQLKIEIENLKRQSGQ